MSKRLAVRIAAVITGLVVLAGCSGSSAHFGYDSHYPYCTYTRAWHGDLHWCSSGQVGQATHYHVTHIHVTHTHHVVVHRKRARR